MARWMATPTNRCPLLIGQAYQVLIFFDQLSPPFRQRVVHLDEVGTFEAVRKPRLKDHLLDGIAANFSHLLQHVAELVTKRECFFIGKPEAISEYCT